MPIPEVRKCCVKGCTNRGMPSEGFEFFLCAGCLKELQRRIAKEEAWETRN